MRYFLFGTILMGVLFMATNSKGQSSNDERLKYQRAVQEIEAVLSSADKIDNPLAKVKVKAKAATLLWTQSPERARNIFLDLWGLIDKQTDETFNKEEARTALLRYIFPKDRTLANQLLQKAAGQTEDKNVSGFDKINGNDPETRRLAFLSYRLADGDTTLAAQVFEQSLAHRTSPMTPFILARLREKNPQLANYLASRVMENINHQPRTVAVFGLTALASYLFPLTPLPANSSEIEESAENLHLQFMSVGYQILKESLVESDDFIIKEQQLPKEGLRFRPVSQATLAAILATLSQHYAPQYFTELSEITNRLISTLPKQVVSLIQMQAAAVRGKIGGTSETETSEVSETEITLALTKGDFKVAQNLIDKLKDEAKRKNWTEILLKAQSKAHLANGELLESLNTARRMEDAAQRMLLLAEIAKAAHKKRDKVLSTDILHEARKTSADSLAKGTHAATLFTITAEAAYFDMLHATLMVQDAVAIVNSMTYSLDKEANSKVFSSPAAILNDPNRFVDSIEMMRAFAALGEANMEDTLLIAGKFENKPVQLAARLATVEKILKKGLPKVKPEPRLPSKSK